MLDELAALAASRSAVVLDDDPTGTQTLRDVPVLMAWSASAIARYLDEPVVFLSTNSRSLEVSDAIALTRAAVAEALAAARKRGRAISLISRADSTLRGHFPAETKAIAAAADMPDARVLLAPFFVEGGRVTVGDVHYLERDGIRVPVAETEFARDRSFGYRSSNLRGWVIEKYGAAGLPPPPLASLDLATVRGGGPAAIARLLLDAPANAVVIANAETHTDIEIVALGALHAEEAGLPLVARVAASYVRARAGRSPAPTLAPGELGVSGPGLVVVGSHVDTTTRQLEHLRQQLASQLDFREITVASLLSRAETTIAEVARTAALALGSGRSPVVLTERTRAEMDLAQGRALSEALAGIVSRLEVRPAWVLAKGGITSSDVARIGLGMREARVAGQLLPGVPVWIGLQGSRWPGMPLVVFPGNVGGTDALTNAVELLLDDHASVARG